jgi:hypothetical protein
MSNVNAVPKQAVTVLSYGTNKYSLFLVWFLMASVSALNCHIVHMFQLLWLRTKAAAFDSAMRKLIKVSCLESTHAVNLVRDSCHTKKTPVIFMLLKT